MALPQRYVDAAGNMVPVGSIRKVKLAEFLDTTVPPWLETSNGTPTLATPGSISSPLSLVTAASNGALATVRTSFDIDTTKFPQIIWAADGVFLGSDSNSAIALAIADSSNNRGVALYQDPSNATMRVIYYTGSTSVSTLIPYSFLGSGEGVKHHNLSLDFRPNLKHLFVLENDSVVWAQQIPTLGTGNCRAYVEATAKSAAALTVSISQLRLELIHD